jgi:hypothetical protein
MYQFIQDPAGDFLAGLTTYLQNQFYAATGCQATLDYGWDINPYDARQVKRALAPCTTENPLPQCGFDMVEIDTVVLDDLVQTSGLIQPIPSAALTNFNDFMKQARKMVKQGGTVYAHPSFACDNLLFSYEPGLSDINNRRDLLDWIDETIDGNNWRLGYSGDMWAVWDLVTLYVDAHMDTFPNRKLCCGANTAYSPNVKPSVARGLGDLVETCKDIPASIAKGSTVNNCLNSVYYNNYTAWFGDFLTGRSVVLAGFSSHLSNILEFTGPGGPGSLEGLQIISAPYGAGSQGYMFTDAFVLSNGNCAASGCVDAAALWMNWQMLEGQIIINLGRDLTPQRPRYLVSSNEKFYDLTENPALEDYLDVYNIFYNDDDSGTLQTSRPLNTKDMTNQYCDQYAALTQYVMLEPHLS